MELLELSYRRPQSQEYRDGLAARMASTRDLVEPKVDWLKPLKLPRFARHLPKPGSGNGSLQ